MNLTLDQQNNIKTWVEQRDEILREISVAKIENDILKKQNGELAESNTDLQTRINENKARLEVLDLKEKEREVLISENIVRLIEKQSELKSLVTGLEIDVNSLVNRKGDLISMIQVLEEMHEKIFGKIGVLGQVVDHVKRVGSENTEKANYLLSNVRNELEGFLKNVRDLNISLNDKTTKLNESIDRTVKLHTKISTENIKSITDQDNQLG